MALELVTVPSAEPFTLAEVKAHLRVTAADEDTLISGLITAARSHIDGAAGWLNRALVTQTWKLALDQFPSWRWSDGCIRVPLPPLQSVTSITYLDSDGVQQTLPVADYKVDAVTQPGRIAPAPDKSWPSTQDVMNAVEVTFVAGYGDPSAVPQPIKQGLLLLIGHWFDHREEVITGTIATRMPVASQALLTPFRIFEFV